MSESISLFIGSCIAASTTQRRRPNEETRLRISRARGRRCIKARGRDTEIRDNSAPPVAGSPRGRGWRRGKRKNEKRLYPAVEYGKSRLTSGRNSGATSCSRCATRKYTASKAYGGLRVAGKRHRRPHPRRFLVHALFQLAHVAAASLNSPWEITVDAESAKHRVSQ